MRRGHAMYSIAVKGRIIHYIHYPVRDDQRLCPCRIGSSACSRVRGCISHADYGRNTAHSHFEVMVGFGDAL